MNGSPEMARTPSEGHRAAPTSRGYEPSPNGQTLYDEASAGVSAQNDPLAGENIASFLLADCPKIELPKNRDNPVVVMGGSGSSAAAASDAYKSLRTKLIKLQASRAIRSVAITSASQADGKTLTAFNLACCTAQLEDTSVLLVDADLRTHALTTLVGHSPTIGLAEVLKGTAAYEDAIVRTNVPNLYVIGAGDGDADSSELLSNDRWEQFMRWASRTFKLVLVDSLPVGVVADFELIGAACDGVVVVARALRTSRGALGNAIKQIDPKKLLGVVWNAHPVVKGNYYVYEAHPRK